MAAWQRVKTEVRHLLEVVLLPGLAAVLPWRWCFALFKRIACWNWLYQPACEIEWNNATAKGYGGDKAQWTQHRRLVQLVDHADHYLHRTRSDAWMHRHMDVYGDWRALGEPSFLFSFHWGAGMWALRHARSQGLQVNAIAAPILAENFQGRSVFFRYAQARIVSIEQALGRSVVLVPKGLRNLRTALKQGQQVLALLDVPQDRGAVGHFQMLGETVRLSQALPEMAERQQAPMAVYVTAFDAQTGRRALHIQNLPAGMSAAEVTQFVVTWLDGLIRDQPAAWHFWGMWPAFVAPAQPAQAAVHAAHSAEKA